MSYKSYQQLPTKLSDFYDALFQTLLQRHDGSKPGFTRQRGCALDDNEYRQVFEALCILAKKRKLQTFDVRVMSEMAKDAMIQCGFNANASSFVDDIVKITCLIIRDGEEHRFIHKTVQEYYTASHIQRRPEAWADDFYSRVSKTNASREWEQKLGFLSEIDTYTYKRFFYLPAVLSFLNMSERDLSEMPAPVSTAFVASIFQYVLMTFPTDTLNRANFRMFPMTNTFTFLHYPLISNTLFHLPVKTLCREASEVPDIYEDFSETLAKTFTHGFRLASNEKMISIGKAIAAGGMPTVVAKAQKELIKLIEEARDLSASLRAEESISLLDGLV
jgi:hypothetical protein